MNKGFTLVELLIVMVIVGTLVALALPKYQNTLERGRCLEGIRNVQYVAEYVNAKCLARKAAGQNSCTYTDFQLPQMDQIKSTFFSLPTVSDAGTVTTTRSKDWGYSITATIDTANDTVYQITCSNTGEEDVCAELDLTGNLMTRK